MAVRIHEIDVTTQRRALLGLLGENLPDYGGEPHFDWLYLRNPSGKARAWVVEDEGTAAWVGIAAAFPRQLYLEGRQHLCWNLGDFAIRRDYRSLGPAVALQRACLAAVGQEDAPLAYDHPHSTMMPVYRRLGIPSTGPVVRYAKPLRVDDKLRAITKLQPVGRGVARLGNLLLKAADLGRRRSAAGTTVTEVEEIDARFDQLDQRIGPSFPVVGCRNAAYLRWRYLECPDPTYEIVTAEQDGTLRGYAVFRRHGKTGRIVDLYAEPDPVVADGLVGRIVEIMRERGVATLSMPTLPDSVLATLLERWGFRPRESAQFVVTTAVGGRWDGVVNQARNWFLTHGDRDV